MFLIVKNRGSGNKLYKAKNTNQIYPRLGQSDQVRQTLLYLQWGGTGHT